MPFFPELETLELPTLIEHFTEPSVANLDDRLIYLQEVAARLGRLPGGARFLRTFLSSGHDEQQTRAAIGELAHLEPSVGLTEEELESWLNDPRPVIVMEAIDALRHRADRKVADKVVSLLGSPSDLVRAAVLRYIGWLDPLTALPTLLEALHDRDPIVRQEAADSLGDWQLISAIPYLRALLQDPDPHVRQAVATSLDSLEAPN